MNVFNHLFLFQKIKNMSDGVKQNAHVGDAMKRAYTFYLNPQYIILYNYINNVLVTIQL